MQAQMSVQANKIEITINIKSTLRHWVISVPEGAFLFQTSISNRRPSGISESPLMNTQV